MNLKDLEEELAYMRENGAIDNTKVRVYDLDHRVEANSMIFVNDDDGGFIVISP